MLQQRGRFIALIAIYGLIVLVGFLIYALHGFPLPQPQHLTR